jgi:excinuclease UvrABC ATPase subunit
MIKLITKTIADLKHSQHQIKSILDIKVESNTQFFLFLASLICRLLQLLMNQLFHYLRQSCVLILNRDYKFSFEIQVFLY